MHVRDTIPILTFTSYTARHPVPMTTDDSLGRLTSARLDANVITFALVLLAGIGGRVKGAYG
jgi:hypothetical protein